jgi:hypothetical protein
VHRARNLMVTFLLSGLWHGANWTFVIWGLLNGLAVLLWPAAPAREPAARWSAARAAATFAIFSLSLIFFRARSVADAWWVVTHLAHFGAGAASSLATLAHSLARPMSELQLVSALVVFGAVYEVERRARERGVEQWFAALAARSRLTLDYATLSAILLFGEFHGTEFIYFQF